MAVKGFKPVVGTNGDPMVAESPELIHAAI
jgi:hypothetical protein